ncbi:DUF2203 domain-containing protein [Corallococcus sp. H22C18031201]|nr:DUF2203 domain-containing protein [Citreicoccus inhibens]RJS21816.1 DUF2203 domain-containing protein [Corallococcus sp. H22C18031201]
MRFFSVEEANRLVPLLHRTFERVRPWVDRVQRLAEDLEVPGDRSEAALEPLRDERDALLNRIRGELLQIQEMGLEIKGADGLVDFRARRGERHVYLCWRFGENEVSHWHDLQTGIAGRRPIDNPDDFAPTYLS